MLRTAQRTKQSRVVKAWAFALLRESHSFHCWMNSSASPSLSLPMTPDWPKTLRSIVVTSFYAYVVLWILKRLSKP